jgi:hypothetical protein
METGKTNFMIAFDRIMVNAMETNSGIFVGTNLQYGWSSHNKTNASISGISGDGNELKANVNVIYDNDAIDTSIDDRDILFDAKKMSKAS